MILLDTNVLARMTRGSDPQSGMARQAVQKLLAQRERLVIVPQNLYEFWSVATRPLGLPPAGRNGLGMTPAQAGSWIRFFRRRFVLLTDRDDLSSIWQALVESHGISGYRAHDVRLVAAMQSHGLSRLLTFNGTDFRDLNVTVIDPAIQ